MAIVSMLSTVHSSLNAIASTTTLCKMQSFNSGYVPVSNEDGTGRRPYSFL